MSGEKKPDKTLLANTPEAIVLLFDSIQQNLNNLREENRGQNSALNEIVKSVVDKQDCKDNRIGCHKAFEDIFRKIERIEKTCTEFETIKPDIVLKNDLTLVTIDSQKLDKIDEKLSAMENKLKFLDFTWKGIRTLFSNNKGIAIFALITALTLLITLFNTTIGRLHDYGLI